MICCTVCGAWYPLIGRDRLDICPDCFLANFAGANPPLDLHATCTQETVQAYLDTASSSTRTPYQRAALARLHASWRWPEGMLAPPPEETP